MAEREVTVQNKICSNCSASIDHTWVIKNLYRCKVASLELKLGRIPTTKDTKRLGVDVSSVPSGCPNGYHSPENLPLR